VSSSYVTVDSPDSLGGILYPFSQVQCIEPIYNSDIHNILGMGHLRAPPPTHTTIDPCRTPQPQVLLVEDDETRRRIGGILLNSLQRQIDSALDGLEAVT
jgi:osomolarity two-component system response regulator SKN7